MNKKVIFLGNSLFAMLNFRKNILYYLAEIGYTIYIVAPFDCEFENKKNIFYIDFKINTRSNSIKGIYDNILKINKLVLDISKNDTDIIIIPYSPILIMISLIALCNQKINIIPFYSGLGSLYLHKRYFLFRKILSYLINNNIYCKQIICLNLNDKELLSKSINKKILLLKGEGVDENIFKFINNVNEDNLRFIIITRPVVDKGIIVFLKAVELFNKFNKNTSLRKPEFIIYGFDSKSDLRDLPSDFINKCELNNIILEGKKNNLLPFIKSKDILIIPSLREGMSRVCMEMHELGLPVIGNNVPGISDIVSHNITGILINDNDPMQYAISMNFFSNLPNKEFLDYRNIIKIQKRKYASLSSVRSFYLTLINNIN